MKQPAGGLPYFKAALEASPDDSQFWLSYIDTLTALFNEGRCTEIEPFVHAMTERFPNHGFGWKLLGAVLRSQGRRVEALMPLQKAAELLPEDAEAHSNLGNALREQGRLAEAEANCRRALEINPDYAQAHCNLGVALLEQGRIAEAEASCRRALAIKPDFAEAHSNLGNALKEQGRLAEAEASHRSALAIKPEYFEAHNNLGVALQAQGRLAEAEASYGRALEIKPDYAQAQCNLGSALKDQGRIAEAQACYARALAIVPDSAEAHASLGAILLEQGRFAQADASYRRALELKPDYAEARCNLGVALLEQGRPAEAEASLRRALEIKKDFPEAHSNLGNALKEQGRLAEAEASHRCALAIAPEYADAHNNLGVALQAQGRLAEAEASYRCALELKRNFAEAQCNLGVTLQKQGRLAEAEASHRCALAMKPDYAQAHNNLGVTLQEQDRLAEAQACYGRALEINPDYVEAHCNLGNTLKDQGSLAEAEASYRRALEIKPDYADAHSNLLFTMNYAPGYDASRSLEEAREYGRRVVAKVAARFSSWQCVARPERLRVGLVSGDLHNHPVGYFLEGVLAHIDPARFELIAYPTRPREDELTARLRAHLARWQPLFGRSDEAAANLIHADGVHLLLDLSGHTAHNRLPVFAWKPAPVQASWLGYFATTGVAAIDYLIADPWTVPQAEETQFTEQIWRLPETRWCFTAPQVNATVSPLPALTEGHITFGCFNNLTKMNDDVVALGARVLEAVPHSRLYLKTKQLAESSLRDRVLERFAARGIGGERLILEGPAPRADYLAAYGRVDIALDPFPFTGGTTSAEALWMGVPVLTLAGEHLVSRQGVGLLMNAGLPDWIAADHDDYVARAVAHTANLEPLAALRSGLRAQVLVSPLFDAPRFARHLEQALWGMWQRGQKPKTYADFPRSKTECSGTVDRTAQPQTQSGGTSLGELLEARRTVVRKGQSTKKRNSTDKMSSSPKSLPQAERNRLVALFNAGRHAELEGRTRSLVERYPDSGFAWKVLGACLQVQGKEALPALQRAAGLLSDDAETHSNLGNALRVLGQPDAAAASCTRALEINPEFAEAHNNLGNALKDLGKLDVAVASYRRALEIRPDYAEARINLGMVLQDLGKPADAAASYRLVLQANPDHAEAHGNLGNVLQDLGQFDEAVASYRRALETKPDYADAHGNLGNALQDLGQFDEAVASYRRALEIKPDFAEAHSNLGNALRDLGQLDNAVASYRRALEIKPDFADAHSNLGNALRSLGQLDDAVASYRRALEIKPGYAEAYNNLGNALRDLGQLDEAVASYRRALEIKPDYAEAHNNMGNALRDLGHLYKAVASYRRALEIKPDYAEAHVNLCIALRDQGRLDDALASCRRALEIKPDFPQALNHLALLFNAQGHAAMALDCIKQSLQIRETGESRRIFLECIKRLRFTHDDSQMRVALIRALTEPWGRPGELARIGIDFVKLNPEIGRCVARATAAWPARLPAPDLFGVDGLTALADDPLLCTLLVSAPVCDSEMERFLSMARHAMLMAAAGWADSAAELRRCLHFFSALARQCFINEYLFCHSDDEIRKAGDLRDLLVAALEARTPVPALWPVAVASYFPLGSLPLAARLLDTQWPEAVTAVLVQQLREPEEELQLRAAIPRLTRIEDEVSLRVQNQYEEHPYPRWLKTAPAGKTSHIVGYLCQKFPLAPFERHAKRGDMDILIAGCGTGQHAIETAQRFQGAKVLAVDLSMSSLGYARRKSQALGLTSIEYAQADLLKLDALGRRFDVVESVGVLHHLADPLAGWRVLLSLLRPGGFMRLGLYSEVARRTVVRIRSFIAAQGYGATTDDIRRCRQDLVDLDRSPEFRRILNSPDFFSTSACRDLLFHVQEHRMTLAGIDAFLRENNLAFLGFDIDPHVLDAYRQRFPDDAPAIDLGLWRVFENDNPDTFFGMYQFWIQKPVQPLKTVTAPG